MALDDDVQALGQSVNALLVLVQGMEKPVGFFSKGVPRMAMVIVGTVDYLQEISSHLAEVLGDDSLAVSELQRAFSDLTEAYGEAIVASTHVHDKLIEAAGTIIVVAQGINDRIARLQGGSADGSV